MASNFFSKRNFMGSEGSWMRVIGSCPGKSVTMSRSFPKDRSNSFSRDRRSVAMSRPRSMVEKSIVVNMRGGNGNDTNVFFYARISLRGQMTIGRILSSGLFIGVICEVAHFVTC
ncbi:hypothetical protein MT325_m705L [Paramecium bursaria chlorella virus MT325]|uniref:Uncharacterized protein m705L n=1 Tax=Paramecium bursaria Chlorella virus MT325 TaxID=346932 RepID=A7IV85_PBCVM|nr:hypothetical protein MT325_m705L [Paramecium bursaria chlorella virus MT325]